METTNKPKPTSIRLSSEHQRLLELLKKAMKRPTATNVIEVLIEEEAERRNLK